jgi:hypothetical protein
MYDLNTIKKQNKSRAIKLIDRTKLDGGVSFNGNLEEIKPNYGFTVSMYDIIKTSDLGELEKALNKLQNYSNSFYGLWLNDGLYYLDANLNVSDLSLALALGKLTNQKCVWDEVKKQEVKL